MNLSRDPACHVLEARRTWLEPAGQTPRRPGVTEAAAALGESRNDVGRKRPRGCRRRQGPGSKGGLSTMGRLLFLRIPEARVALDNTSDEGKEHP